MPTETWFVLTIAGTSLLLGLAGPLLVWLACKHRLAGFERTLEQRLADLTDRLEAREGGLENRPGNGELPPGRPESLTHHTPSSQWPGPSWPTTSAGQGRDRPTTRVDGSEPPLIAVPNLAAAANDREVVVSGLTQRYAAIWSLSASGSSADVIAKATGQPIGQIELILGLRRQIAGTQAHVPHASHT